MHTNAAKDSLLGMNTLSLKGTLLMNVVQTTAAATTLGRRGSTGPSHRKWVMTLRCACVPMKALPMKTYTWSWWRSVSVAVKALTMKKNCLPTNQPNPAGRSFNANLLLTPDTTG